MKFLFFVFSFLASLNAFNVEISSSEVANGKTVLFVLEKEDGVKYKSLLYKDKHYKVLQHPLNQSKMYVLLPISYYEKPSDKKVKLLYQEKKKEKEKTYFLRVKDGKYKKESIKVSSSKVHLNAKDKKRASKEYSEAMKVYNSVSPKSYINSEFIAPMTSKITSSFGKARVYNNTLKGYHSGTDYRAKVGERVKTVNDGVVALVKDRFYSGGSVVVDHGQGIYTCYFHLSEFKVKKGERVKKGQVIGLSGKSGRVTGPHLHFAARVNGVQVDPLQLMALMNENILNKDTK